MKFVIPQNRPALMGILNITPDSFSDGGQFMEPKIAFEHALRMMDEGADLIDVGGESTRPGALEVEIEEEWRRIGAPIKQLCSKGIPISVDTSKTEIARRALDLGACVVNDVKALKSEGMAQLCAEAGITVCLMHMPGDPRTMQQNAVYDDVVLEVRKFIIAAAERAIEHGFKPENIWVDPGFGFGKTVEQNLEILRNLNQIAEDRYPVLAGLSRKSFIGKILSSQEIPLPASERLEGTLAAQTIAQLKGARIIRAHDVLASRRVIDVAQAVLSA